MDGNKRVQEALALLPRHLESDFVFVNPETGTRWSELRPMFHKARRAVFDRYKSVAGGGFRAAV